MRIIRVLFYTVISSLGGFLFGYELAILSGSIVLIQKDFELDEKLTSLLVSCVLIGAVMGSIIGGKSSEKIGRKKTMYLGLIGVGVGGILGIGFPSHFDIFLSTRIITGIGIGIIFMVIPVYVAEISPPRIRGALGSFMHLFVGLGLTGGFYLCYNLPYFRTNYIEVIYGWKWLYFMEFPLSLILGALLYAIPESPRWLIFHQEGIEAEKILDKISSPKDEEKTLAAVSEVLQMEKREVETSSGLGYAVKLKDTVINIISLPFFAQITGVSVIIYYAATIFQDVASKTMRLSQYEMVIIGVAYMIGVAGTMVLVDIIGRKPILIMGGFLMALGTFQIGVGLVVKEVSQISAYMMLVYIAAHSFSIGSIVTIYLSEILPDGIRGYGMGIAGMFYWFSSMFAEFLFPMMQSTHPMLEKLNGSIPFFFFGVVSIGLLVFSFSIRETKGKTLEEIEEDWYKLDKRKIKNKFYK